MKFYTTLQKLVGTRGTKQQIADRIHQLTNRTTRLSQFEENLPDNDLGFQFTLGMDREHYLDFDIYLIKTRAKHNGKPVWYTTEINQSY